MLAEILKEKRKELNMTQKEIAERLNVTRQTVSSWEVGKSIPDISSLIEISELYDISLDYMLKGDTKVTQKLKKDTVELKFLRHFSTSTLMVIGVLIAILFPVSILFVSAILIYITVFKKQNINIIIRERKRQPMKKNSSYLGQAVTDALSVMGMILLFYVVLSFFNENIFISHIFDGMRNRIWLIFFCLCMIIGRYWRYRQDNK